MTDTIRFSLEKSKGYSGHRGDRSYIARILGSSAQYTFNREFLEADDIDWGDSQLFKRSKGTWTEKYDLGEGLYERQQYGERSYRLVFVPKNGKLQSKVIEMQRAWDIAKQMDAGLTFDQARVATKPPRPASAAQNEIGGMAEDAPIRPLAEQ